MRFKVLKGKRVKEVRFDVDADKSISHRCAIFSLLTDGVNRFKNYLPGEDTRHSLKIAEQLGATVTLNQLKNGDLEVEIVPPSKIKEPTDILYCGNSGTTIRIYSGLLAGVEGFFVLSGDRYLNRRPMGRVVNPLRQIGAKIEGRADGKYPPLGIRGGKLKRFKYHSPISSAQVKSALILAGLQGEGDSYYREPTLSRDHTERMLKGMGVGLKEEKGWIKIPSLKGKRLPSLSFQIPNDPSSGFFFGVWAAITGNKAIIPNITLNPTRVEGYKVLERMGARVEFYLEEDRYEPVGTIVVEGRELKGIEVMDKIPWLIDEIPALAMAMAVAKGVSIVRRAKELRVKESDRIRKVVENLRKFGIQAEELEDGFIIEGGTPRGGVVVESGGDHRIAMGFAILGTVTGEVEITEGESINTSFPSFFQLFSQIGQIEPVG